MPGGRYPEMTPEQVTISVLLAVALCTIADAEPYRFRCVAQIAQTTRAPIMSVRVRPAELRSILGVSLPEGAMHASVRQAATGQVCACATGVRYDGEITVLWVPPGTDEPGPVEYIVELHPGPDFSPVLPPDRTPLTVERNDDTIVVSTGLCRITHSLKHGGLISHVDYGDGRGLDVYMGERLHDRAHGTHSLRNDPESRVSVRVIPGWQATVEVKSCYVGPDGAKHLSEPRADYRFTYRAGSPFVHVKAVVRQSAAVDWDELHVLELRHTEDFYTHRAAGDVPQGSPLDHPLRTHALTGSAWGALLNDLDAMAIVGPQLYGIHDGLGKYGIYVHGPWLTHFTGPLTYRASIYLGPSGGSPEALAEALAPRVRPRRPSLRLPEAQQSMEAASRRLAELRARCAPEQVGPTRLLRAAAAALQDATTAAAAGRGLHDWQAAMGAGGVRGLLDRAEAELESGGAAAGPVVLQGKTFFTLVTGDLCLRAGAEGDPDWGLPLALSQLVDLRTGTRFTLPRTSGPLWALRFRHKTSDEQVRVVPEKAIRGGIDVDRERGLVRLSWHHCGLPGERRTVDVEVTLRFEAGTSEVAMRIKVVSRSLNWGLESVDFPRLEHLDGGPDAQVASPARWGRLLRHPAQGADLAGGYPSGNLGMQFSALTLRDASLYTASHDPSARLKQFIVSPSGEGAVDFVLRNYPDRVGVPGEGYVMDYDAVVAVHRGDWFDAAKRYRAWATREAPWCAGGPLATRQDVPEWLKSCALCFRPSGAPKTVLPVLRNLHRAFDMPALIHWYQWHQIPFDNDYPDYFPTKPGFAEAVAEAQALGLKVMPYINGRLWDTDTQSWAQEGAAAAVVRKLTGEPELERWSGQDHGVMCPTTRLWQEKMKEVVRRLAEECGCAGAYLDQIGAAGGLLCYAPNHDHGPGGANTWVAGETKLLAGARAAARAVDADFVMTTEDNAEPYMAQLDGYLMCNAEGNDLVPLFAAVYGGYTLTFGRAGQLDDDLAFAMQHGQAFTFGSMMGRESSDAITHPEHADKLDFLRRLAKLRYRCRDFLALGEMLRPLALEGDVPTLEAMYNSKHKGEVRMPAVLNSVWRAPDGRVGVFLVNISREPRTVAFELNAEECGLPRVAVCRSLPDDGPQAAVCRPEAGGRHEITLRPWHAEALVFDAT